MAAQIGHTVLFAGDILSGGSRIHRAQITRVQKAQGVLAMVGLYVFPTYGRPQHRAEVPLLESRIAAEVYRMSHPGSNVCYYDAK